VIKRPAGLGTFEFVVLATLRAGQLMRGCRPRIEGVHKAAVTAQLEVAEGHIVQLLVDPDAIIEAVLPEVPAEYVLAPVQRG
jgi:hypothetical protein